MFRDWFENAQTRQNFIGVLLWHANLEERHSCTESGTRLHLHKDKLQHMKRGSSTKCTDESLVEHWSNPPSSYEHRQARHTLSIKNTCHSII